MSHRPITEDQGKDADRDIRIGRRILVVGSNPIYETYLDRIPKDQTSPHITEGLGPDADR